MDASGAANSYRVLPSGALSPIGATVANGQMATCWLVQAGRYFYATNTASNTITGYAEAPDGQLSLLRGEGVSALTDAGPIDIAAAPDGREVFELNGLAGDLAICNRAVPPQARSPIARQEIAVAAGLRGDLGPARFFRAI